MVSHSLQVLLVYAASAVHSGKALPINPNLLGFSSYAGPVVNLTYDDPSMMKVVKALGIGSLRYPGGSPANNWNITSGRWTGKTGELPNRTAALPEGTFSPDSYMKGIGSLLQAAPIWNLNLVSMPQDEMVGQIDVLKRMGVPVQRLELGNELANNDCDTYLSNAALVVARARDVFPNAEIGIIGSWGNPATDIPPWSACEKRLQDHLDLFDAVTVHTYSPGDKTISQVPDWAQPTLTLAAPQVLVNYHVKEAAKYAGGKPIWLDEVNWGGPWMGEAWPSRRHGSLRGLLFAAYYLSALNLPEKTLSSLNWYSLLHQDDNGWTNWASCVHVPSQANRPEEVTVDGVAQVFAHLSFVALRQGYTQVQGVSDVASDTIPTSLSVFGTTGLPCVQAALFSGHDRHCTFMILNRCSWRVNATVTSALAGPQKVNVSLYSGDLEGGWTRLDDISSVGSPPWVGGPVEVKTSHWPADDAKIRIGLSPIGLHIVELTVSPSTQSFVV